MLKAAIFDVDGTLFDSMYIWDTVGGDYLRSLEIRPADDLDRTFRSMSLYQAACYMQKEYALPQSPEEIMAGVAELAAVEYREKIRLKPGVYDYLRGLHEKNIPLCAATASDRTLVEAAMERCGIRTWFTGICTCTEVGHGKDEPHVYLAALECLGTPKEHTLVFEDALQGLRTAKQAGFPTAAVYDPMEEDQLAMRTEADYYLKDLTIF